MKYLKEMDITNFTASVPDFKLWFSNKIKKIFLLRQEQNFIIS
jgi:hypothetical protein